MHESVLLHEAIQALDIKPNGRYVDGTLGYGGHAEAILKKLDSNGRLLALEVDPDALQAAKRRLQPFEDQTITRLVNFRGLQRVLTEVGWTEVDGILLDLGVSSPQLDTASKGFSFQHEGPIDMRLDPNSPTTALSLLKSIDEDTLIKQFIEFGEGRYAKRLARALMDDAAHDRLKTTTDLANRVQRLIGRHGRTHPATRVFLALRCLVNDEMGALREVLMQAPQCLKQGGIMAVISFHSTEDRLVKYIFRDLCDKDDDEKSFEKIFKKPVIASDEEMMRNPRARSAKLRAIKRID